jgi:Protein of unknown function (DUF4238)
MDFGAKIYKESGCKSGLFFCSFYGKSLFFIQVPQMQQNQHYIPQLYLKAFALGGQTAVFDITNDKLFLTNTRNICAEKNLFTINGFDEFIQTTKLNNLFDEGGVIGEKNLLEQQLSKNESKLQPILQRIIKQCSFDLINADQLQLLLEWIAWLYIARPASKQLLCQKHAAISNPHISGFISRYYKSLPFFYAKSWRLWKTSQPLFTGDCPVGVGNLNPKSNVPMNLGILADSPIYFPLAPHLLLLGTPDKSRRFQLLKPRDAGIEIVRHANALMFINSKRIVARKREELINFIDEITALQKKI